MLVTDLVPQTALRAEVLMCESLEGIEVPPALVSLQVIWVAVLDRRVAVDAHLRTQLLAVFRAVHVGNESCLGTLELIDEFVPIRLHRLAVASPARGRSLT
jgi:hypothetical protein